MRLGEIFSADISPTVSSEINKRRLVLIVSNDANYRAAITLIILPIISTVTWIFPFEVALSPTDSGLPKDSTAQAQQIRTISKELPHVADCFLNLAAGSINRPRRPVQPPVIDMKRMTCSGRSLNSWRSGFRAMARRRCTISPASSIPSRSRSRSG